MMVTTSAMRFPVAHAFLCVSAKVRTEKSIDLFRHSRTIPDQSRKSTQMASHRHARPTCGQQRANGVERGTIYVCNVYILSVCNVPCGALCHVHSVCTRMEERGLGDGVGSRVRTAKRLRAIHIHTYVLQHLHCYLSVCVCVYLRVNTASGAPQRCSAIIIVLLKSAFAPH